MFLSGNTTLRCGRQDLTYPFRVVVLGLIYGAMEKPEAAYAEYQEALRIKPSYEVVHYDLGLLFDAGQDEERAIARSGRRSR